MQVCSWSFWGREISRFDGDMLLGEGRLSRQQLYQRLRHVWFRLLQGDFDRLDFAYMQTHRS